MFYIAYVFIYHNNEVEINEVIQPLVYMMIIIQDYYKYNLNMYFQNVVIS